MISLNETGMPKKTAVWAMAKEGMSAAMDRRGPSEE